MRNYKIFIATLLLLISNSCNNVYETQHIPPTNVIPNESKEYFPIVITNTDTELGAIISDKEGKELNLFYGNKDENGNLVHIDNAIAYFPDTGGLISFELNENMLLDKAVIFRNDSTFTFDFNNYDLKNNTVDLDLFDTNEVLIFSGKKIKVEKSLSGYLENNKSLYFRTKSRINSIQNDCYSTLEVVSAATNLIGCIMGPSGIVSRLPGFVLLGTLGGPVGWAIGATVTLGTLYLTADACYDTGKNIGNLLTEDCHKEDSNLIQDQLSIINDCILGSFKKMPKSSFKTILPCLSSIVGAITSVIGEISGGSNPVNNTTSNQPTAISTGDPHLTTMDGFRYSFMAVGEFVAVRSTSDNFEIQVRQEEIPEKSNDGTVSWNTGIAIRTGDGDVCIYPDKIFVNRQNIGTSFGTYNLSGSGSIVKTGQTISVINSAGDIVRISLFGTNFDYQVTLNKNRKGKVEGVLGNYDGVGSNDLRVKDGGLIQNSFENLYPRFSDSWRIKQSESLFVYDTGKNTASYTNRSFPSRRINLTTQQRNSARTICEAAGVTDPVILENCIIDVASTAGRDNTLAGRHYQHQLSGIVLERFSIGAFSTSDVQLDYSGGATATNNEAILDTRSSGFSRILMKQGVNIKNGFVTEFNFSTSELSSSSTFFLAIWPTDEKSRGWSENRIGFGFTQTYTGGNVVYRLDYSTGIIEQKEIPHFVDGKSRKVKITETRQANDQWKVELFFEDMRTPLLSNISNQSISQRIQAKDDVGYIEFQINQGSPSKVHLYNWIYEAK